jgi:hypothetical protein
MSSVVYRVDAANGRFQAFPRRQIAPYCAGSVAVAEDAGLDPFGMEPLNYLAAEYPCTAGDEDFRVVHSG